MIDDNNPPHQPVRGNNDGSSAGGFIDGVANLLGKLADLAEQSEKMRGQSIEHQGSTGKSAYGINVKFGSPREQQPSAAPVPRPEPKPANQKPSAKPSSAVNSGTPDTKKDSSPGGMLPSFLEKSYAGVGGAGPALARIREMIELPLRFPEAFERLGIGAPKGVLLYGPPGCGKTLIARTIAGEADANFFVISGPEIIHKHYGESEAQLRRVFESAAKQAPSIIFIDEIDAIAPKRQNAAGDVERRVVAQLLTLMDGLRPRAGVVVIAATNLPNAIDGALRRPGRFDREIEIPIPDRNGRLEILNIHTRNMPLGDDVDMNRLADITHGFVGADLESLCREAAMGCLRESIERWKLADGEVPFEALSQIRVGMDLFVHAFGLVQPSAIRDVFVEVPRIQWDDIGGMESTKRELIEAIAWPIQHAAMFRDVDVRPSRGILLAGPPGVGKTMLAKAAATQCGVNFINVKVSQVLSKFVGDAERSLSEIFAKARQASPCILFFDEIDGIAPTRDNASDASGVAARVMSQLLSEMDGVEDLGCVFVLAATNRPDRIDPALRRFGRFEKTIHIDLPDLPSRLAILRVHLRNRPLVGILDEQLFAERCEGLTGADIAMVCSMAARLAIRRCVDEQDNVSPAPGGPKIIPTDLWTCLTDHLGQQ